MQELHFRASARGISLCARTVVSLVAMGLMAATAVWAGPVSATPGTIHGVITFNAPFVPTSLEVDARDSTNQYKATANATQNDPANCPAGSPFWCYSIIVESALANGYYLRPIAYINESSPIFVDNRVPFPPSALVPITAGATVPYNISYQPGEVSGTVSGNDMNSQPLQVATLYFSFWDQTNDFQEPCGGSIEFCPFNSVDVSGAPSLPAQATYQDFLKPSETYTYGTRAIGFQEAGGATTTIQLNGRRPERDPELHLESGGGNHRKPQRAGPINLQLRNHHGRQYHGGKQLLRALQSTAPVHPAHAPDSTSCLHIAHLRSH